MSNWQDWLAEQRAKSQMSATVVPLSEAQPWGLQDGGARFGRPDGGFFNLVGVHVVAQREVREWNQPLLQEVGEGAVVLFQSLFDLGYFLVAARQEPGNTTKPGHVLLGPPLQASWSNLQQAHGGKRPPRAELLDGKEIEWVRLTMDGGRFIGKENRYAVVRVSPHTFELADNEMWLKRDELDEALREGEVNEHLALVLLLAVL
ncbi:NDP-hexose 2,3-dehydratase family protein [Candidatus Uhrbacteria bacterium]|nr:NDP-hexose 2,3-dehydratase family protein [Candidatus Uhrbacteria bacterium]